MNEHPIIYQTDMIRAYLDDKKSMTRRVIKGIDNKCDELVNTGNNNWQMRWAKNNRLPLLEICNIHCPYGQVGDKLWVRENYAEWQGTSECIKNYDMPEEEAKDYIIYKATSKDWSGLIKDKHNGHPWDIRPSIHMPRWASRLTQTITDIKVERVQDITEEDAKSEGIIGVPTAFGLLYKPAFSRLWDSINAKRGYSWKSNPWVWVISFPKYTEEPTRSN